ncbi:hypothetical protein NDU88_000297 [Pleurodeles waltl]|uniref:Uncharacterized protein n=1 Tax=Pleurodeles waltl TaxID=8319 RepID=A0AAV7KLU7_PLEWA|nr:hypothetical protein NDU88_000297 [Pleurodeles waltl]
MRHDRFTDSGRGLEESMRSLEERSEKLGEGGAASLVPASTEENRARGPGEKPSPPFLLGLRGLKARWFPDLQKLEC